MICYRCNQEIGKEEMCPFCGADLHVFQKAVRLSNFYYNDGLEKAQVRNLSGAIVSLKKSLRFYKYNIEARNLLGLVYYEIGEAVDALSEWVISKSYKQEDNIAERYLNELKSNRSQLETINQTIKKYNQALLYCRQESRDMAVIQLKKVLSLNPKLVKAHQLLALLYIQDGKLEQAKKSLRNAGKIDTNNTITLRYLKEVNAKMKEKGSSKNKKKKEENLISYQSGNETIIMPNRFQDYSLGSTLVYLLIGLIVGASVIGFLVVPGVQTTAKQEMNNKLVEANTALSSNAQLINSLEVQIAELEAKLVTLEGQADELPAQIAAYEALLSSYVAFVSNDVITAGDMLEAVDVAHLSENAKEIHTTLWTQMSVSYYTQLYTVGYSSYSAKNYADAIDKLLRVVNYDIAYNDGYAAYYLAQSYRKNGDLVSAKPYYQYVIDNYPNTERAATARNYVNAE